MKQFTVLDIVNTFTNVDLSRKNGDHEQVLTGHLGACEYGNELEGRAGDGVYPRCIAGHAVFTLDIGLFNVLRPGVWSNQPDHVKRNFTYGANLMLVQMQGDADAGATWGRCLAIGGVTYETVKEVTNTFKV